MSRKPDYALPNVTKPPRLKKRQVQLVASGDLRASANEKCWPAQANMEEALHVRVADAGLRAGPRAPVQARPAARLHRLAEGRHGRLPHAASTRDAPLIVAESVWQYSHHVLPGLIAHRGPILTAANWSGTWPGLVGMLNLNGSLTKAGVALLDDLERGLHRRALHAHAAPVAAQGLRAARHVARHQAPQRQGPRPRAEARRGPRRPAPPRAGDPRRVRRRVHGDVQRDHPRPPAQPDRRVQGTAQPVGALLRDRRRSRDDEALAVRRLDGAARDDVSSPARTKRPT